MTAREVVHHDARAVRRKDGFVRWFAWCPGCGYEKNGRGKEAAEHLADLHNRLNPDRGAA